MGGKKRKSEEDDLSIDFGEFLPQLRQWFPLILLLLIVGYGFSLRSYHLDYPVIGYHNTKEAHTLSEALNFFEGESLLTPRQHYYSASDQTRGTHGDNFPLVAWIIVLGWKIFGLHLWVARTVIVKFALGIVILTYIVVKQLFNREDISLFAALLTAACPLLVFFGRNVQYDVPSTFFLMGAIAAYLQWRKDPKTAWFALMSLSAALAAVSKWPTIILLVPIVATFPWKRVVDPKELRSNIQQFAWGLPAALLAIWWWFYSKTLNPTTAVSLQRDAFSHVSQFFTKSWWTAVYQYAITDNFSKIGVTFAILGFLVTLLYFKRFRYRFLAIWSLSFLLFGLLFANFLSHHNYYQTAYAPLWAILVAVFLNFAVSFIPKVKIGSLPSKTIRWLALLAIFFLLLRAPLQGSVDRQWATQFHGLDVAGEYIKEHGTPGELVFNSGHQDRGVLWHADRELVRSGGNVDEIRDLGDKVGWVFAYQWGITGDRVLAIPEMADYIYENYRLKQFGFYMIQTPQGNQVQEMHYLFRRGEPNYNRQELLQNLTEIYQENPPQQRKYDDPIRGQVPYFYINLE